MQERRGDTAKRGDPVTENAEGVRSFFEGKEMVWKHAVRSKVGKFAC
jgi:hypothetical protein